MGHGHFVFDRRDDATAGIEHADAITTLCGYLARQARANGRVVFGENDSAQCAVPGPHGETDDETLSGYERSQRGGNRSWPHVDEMLVGSIRAERRRKRLHNRNGVRHIGR